MNIFNYENTILTTDRDMKAIYRELYKLHPEGFPEILLFDEMPVKYEVVRHLFTNGKSAIFVKNGTDEEIISRINDEIKHPCHHVVDGSVYVSMHMLEDDEVSVRLVFASYIAEILDIVLEPIVFASNDNDLFGWSDLYPYTLNHTANLNIAVLDIITALRISWQISEYGSLFWPDISLRKNISDFYYTFFDLDVEAFSTMLLRTFKLESQGYYYLPASHSNIHPPTEEDISLYYSVFEKRINDITVNIPEQTLDIIRKLLTPTPTPTPILQEIW